MGRRRKSCRKGEGVKEGNPNETVFTRSPMERHDLWWVRGVQKKKKEGKKEGGKRDNVVNVRCFKTGCAQRISRIGELKDSCCRGGELSQGKLGTKRQRAEVEKRRRYRQIAMSASLEERGSERKKSARESRGYTTFPVILGKRKI